MCVCRVWNGGNTLGYRAESQITCLYGCYVNNWEWIYYCGRKWLVDMLSHLAQLLQPGVCL